MFRKILPVKGLAAVAPLAPAVPGGLDPLAVPGGRRPWLVRKACWNPDTKDKVVVTTNTTLKHFYNYLRRIPSLLFARPAPPHCTRCKGRWRHPRSNLKYMEDWWDLNIFPSRV